MSKHTPDSKEQKPSELIKLAEKKFFTLTEADKKLFRAVENGKAAVFSSLNEEDNEPSKADKWGPERTLNADHIIWLCTDKKAKELLTHKGIEIIGARIDGLLDLSFVKMDFPLYLHYCYIPKVLILKNTNSDELSFIGSHTGPIFADSFIVKGDVFMRDGFRSEGEVRMFGAQIGGQLDCSNGQFINPKGNAFSADGFTVKGDVFMRDGFKAEGEVKMPSAQIGGQLDCTNGQFINPEGTAFLADSLTVKEHVFMRGGFKAEGEVKMPSAQIGGQLDCSNGRFINPKGNAFSADGFTVKGPVFMRGDFKAEGEVRIPGAQIGGQLSCINGQFINPKGTAFSADTFTVECDVIMRDGFKAEGEVRMLGAQIGGQLDCSNGRFINPKGTAFLADRFTVKGDLFLSDGFKAEGEVRMLGVQIDGHFCYYDVDSPEKIILNLEHANIGTLYDAQESWPVKGNLFLYGLIYKQIAKKSPRDAKIRIEWLRRQLIFSPQPYEQLAKVFRESGLESEAKKVLIAKNEDYAKQAKLNLAEKFWYSFLGKLIGYGYRPSGAIRWSLIIILFGILFFNRGYHANLLMPTSDNYPSFNSWIYSLDVFVPVVDFYQAKYWLPDIYHSIGLSSIILSTLLRVWFWFEIASGWVLSTLLVISFTKLVRT